ncbi:MAG TPA: DUF3048 domain-containing protein [Candidatus Saccharimonadales bacterium]
MKNDFLPRRGKRPNIQSSLHARFHPHHLQTAEEFRPPEDIADEEEQANREQPQPNEGQSVPLNLQHDQPERANIPPKANAETEQHPTQPAPKQGVFAQLKHRLASLSKKQWIIIGVITVVVLSGAGVGAYFLWLHHTPAPVVKKTTVKKAAPAPIPQPILSSLTGLPVADASVNNLPVTAIMIENSIDARPQSGLNDAGVVFEAIAEGGITRFLTLWQDTAPAYVGPVRSVRPYYLQWLQGFDAPVAHVGGSADALELIKRWGVKDLDQFYNPAPYWRVNTRYAPHNMYTDLTKLHALEEQKGFGKSNFTGFPRKAEAPAKAVTARSIDLNPSGPVYASHYDYDPATNSYLRSEGGSPHIDANTNKQISPKVVIALFMNQGQNGVYTTYDTLGTGNAVVFQDGTATAATWAKGSNTDQFTFKDASGAALKLNPGHVWFTVLGGSDRLTYKP